MHRRGAGSAARLRSSATSAALVDGLLAVAVAVDREQHHGLDLREAVDHRAGTELRCARRPDRAEARGGEERDQRLRDVRRGTRRPGRRGRTPSRCSPARQRATSIGQLPPRDARTRRGSGSWATTATSSPRVSAAAERLLGVVERGPREPPRARHPALAQRHASGRSCHRTPDHSATAVQNPSRSSTDHRQRSGYPSKRRPAALRPTSRGTRRSGSCAHVGGRRPQDLAPLAPSSATSRGVCA